MRDYSNDMIEFHLKVDSRSLPVDAVTVLDSLARSLSIRFGAAVRGTSIVYPPADDRVVVSLGGKVDLTDRPAEAPKRPHNEGAQSLDEQDNHECNRRSAMWELCGGAPTNRQRLS